MTSRNVLNPGLISTKMQEMMEAIEQNRLTFWGDPRPFTMVGDKKFSYIIMMGSAPMGRGNELMLQMVNAIPEDCHTVFWRNKPELSQLNPFQREPRVVVRMRLLMLNEAGDDLNPRRYMVNENEPPIEIEDYDEKR